MTLLSWYFRRFLSLLLLSLLLVSFGFIGSGAQIFLLVQVAIAEDNGDDPDPGEPDDSLVDTTGAVNFDKEGNFVGGSIAVSTEGAIPSEVEQILNESAYPQFTITALLDAGFTESFSVETPLGVVQVFDKDGVSVAVFIAHEPVTAETLIEFDSAELRDLFDLPPDIDACLLPADPAFALNPPLTTFFKILYTTSNLDCSPPVPSWSEPPERPCDPITGCYRTYTERGIYGPYKGSVQYFRLVADVEGGAQCRPALEATVRCRSPKINVGGPGCRLTASPTSGTAPLDVDFDLTYTNIPGECKPPTYSWISTSTGVSAEIGGGGKIAPSPITGPCNLSSTSPNTARCSATYPDQGTYGPYRVAIQYYEEDPEKFICRASTWESCSSPQIEVSGGPPPPPSFRLDFDAIPGNIARGASSLLEWRTIPDAQTCLGFCVSGDCEEWGPRGMIGANKAVNGSQRVTPLQTSRYGLRCFSATGDQVYKEAPVTVSQVRWREILPRFPLLGPFFARVLR